MKNLILINGTMGAGKSTTSHKLLKLLPNCVFLDGDWCWYADPWIVNDETKNMVEKNMSFVLNNFLNCSAYENVVFCWVMHTQSMIDMVCSWLETGNHNVYKFSLVCSESALKARLQKDIDDNVRKSDIIKRALLNLPNYSEMETIKIDISDITPEQAANVIYHHIY